MGYGIFLSHTATDAPWVKWIASHVRAAGIEAYLYEHDPRPGREIAGKVKANIQVCDSLVVFLSENSRFSPYVQQEIGFAEASRKLIIPLVQPGLDQRALAMLQGREYVSFDYGNPQEAMGTLIPYLVQLKAKKESVQALLALAGLVIGALALFGEK
jgi:TIR domain-containing protein